MLVSFSFYTKCQDVVLYLDKPWFIFGSSREVYGEQQRLPVREDSEKKPINIYGISKYNCEQLVQNYSTEFQIKCIILRFSNVYGNEMDIR